MSRLLTEPTVRFFVIGALLFLAHRLVVGDPRVIVVSPGVKADLERRFRDRSGRPPSPSELETDLHGWERDEALYREALRERLDRDDATIRTILVDRVRARAGLGVPKREPSRAELERWLGTHQSLYETPRRYDYESVAFPKTERSAAEQLEKYQQALKGGADPRTLGQPIIGGNWLAEDLQQRFGPALAARIQSLPVGGPWQRLEDAKDLLLVRLNAVAGGLPSVDQAYGQLVADFMYAERQRAVDAAVQAIVDRYHLEERR